MKYDTYPEANTQAWEPTAIAALVFGLFAVLITAIELQSRGLPVLGLRAVVGTLLLLFAPGSLLACALGIGTGSFGRFSLFSVGLSIGVLSAVTTAVSVFRTQLGAVAPLSLSLLLVLLGTSLSLLAVVAYFVDGEFVRPRLGFNGSLPVVSLLVVLPTLATIASVLRNRFETNIGMFVFIGAVLLVVLLASTRYLPTNLYPVTAFLVSFSTFLHRNLLTDHVVGADIQATYATAQTIMRVGYWSPELGGSSMAVPVVSSLPASFATVTGLELTVVYKLVYVFAFALVPVGLYYLSSDVFDEDVGLFGAFLFSFYHVSFYFTPGKQLISELFVVLLLLLIVRDDREGIRPHVAVLVLSIGLIQSHYAMTYVFGLSLVVAYVSLLLTQWTVGVFEHDLSFWYPVSLLAVATAWYAYASSELFDTLASVPDSLGDQAVELLFTGTIEGSGASYVTEQTTVFDQLNLFLYFVVIVFVGVGLAYQILRYLGRIHRGERPDDIELTALAVPLFVFLGSSYFLIINLYADRVYQMVLTVLAPFVVVGYGYVCTGMGAIRDRLGVRRQFRSWQVPLAILVMLLLAFNSGLVFSLVGTADTSTFNENAHDLAFNERERAGAAWLEERTAIARPNVGPLPSSAADGAPAPGTIRVYTDPVTAQMFRSELPSSYYTVDVELLKSDFDPRLDIGDIEGDYVFIRERSIVEGSGSERVPTSALSEAEVQRITESGDVVYANGAVRIVETDNGTAR